ncbi:uncharacterized protein ASCRUDRAFT_68587 [Ascoidea rubescens DSM 1968]|uniref:Uncharacterized protein n=1 Tax=Ascoidea rubescens DSM 1968 TaxID=1344418 RepID=A0A1D2VMH7_9ASCO|nr:hypothetical protein ASCRUDRAFT_68587 [Ascoidea rubescens DSM 1968]ODV62755.1 hypothetical protein ASCRUDRAFT_68587 [Ascoidea rubescens DSM 1968]
MCYFIENEDDTNPCRSSLSSVLCLDQINEERNSIIFAYNSNELASNLASSLKTFPSSASSAPRFNNHQRNSKPKNTSSDIDVDSESSSTSSSLSPLRNNIIPSPPLFNANSTIISQNTNALNTSQNNDRKSPIFKEKSSIKPWLQDRLLPLGIFIVIERSDDTKIVFKCKSHFKSTFKNKKLSLMDDNAPISNNSSTNDSNSIKISKPKFKRSKNINSCPFRIRANYSIKAKRWSLVIVNEHHNHSLSPNFDSIIPLEEKQKFSSSPSSSYINGSDFDEAAILKAHYYIEENNRRFSNLLGSSDTEYNDDEPYNPSKDFKKKTHTLINNFLINDNSTNNDKISLLNSMISDIQKVITKIKSNDLTPIPPTKINKSNQHSFKIYNIINHSSPPSYHPNLNLSNSL